MRKLISLIALLGVLSACNMPYATNDKSQYLSSRNGDKLVSRAPLTRTNISDFYDLPAVGKVSAVSLIPPQT
jgi:uncharacterized lipoprotein